MKLVFAVLMIAAPIWAVAQAPSAGAGEAAELGFENLLDGARDVLQAIEALDLHEPDTPAPKDALVLSARRAVEIALAQNPQIFAANEEVHAAEARIGIAKSAILPRLSADTAFTYRDNSDLGFTDNFLTDLIAPDSVDVDELTRRDHFGVQQVVYSGGQIRAACRASRFLAESEEWRREAAIDSIEFQTRRAFYDCLLARALVVVARDSIVTFERHRADTQQMLDVGLVSRFEVLRAETELGSREADLVEAVNRERLAYAALRRLLAVSQETPLVLAERIAWIPLEDKPEALTERAMGKRPEILALLRAIEAAEQDTKRLRGQYRPRGVASADWTNSSGAGSFVTDGWTFTLGLEWELYAGGRRKHEVHEAEARLAGLQHQLADVELLVELDVRQAYIQVQDSIAKIKREQGNVELALEGQRLAELRFQEGVGIQVDVLDAQFALTSAETQLVVALREYAVAHAALDKAIGRSSVTRD